MLCPKCKKEIDDRALKCIYCGTKVGLLCTECGGYNIITAKECQHCGKTLLKICPECGAANRPEAKKCRKCENLFVEKKQEQQIQPQIKDMSVNSQQTVKAKLVEYIKNADSKIITLSAESGYGKNIVLNSAINELKNANILWLNGVCTQSTQLSPFGYFQDLLLTFFNINNFCADTLQFKKNSIKFFKQDFPELENSEVLDLLNILYPENTDKYENIYYNKMNSYNIMRKVIFTIIRKMKTVFIIDNFEFIDGMSFEFIKELLNDNLVLDRCKFIILSKEQLLGAGLLYSPKLSIENYANLSIGQFSQKQVETFMKQQCDFKVSTDVTNRIYQIAKGNPAETEQMILLYKSLRQHSKERDDYNSMEDVLKLRLMLLKHENYNAYKILVAFSVLGTKFYPATIDGFDNLTLQELETLIKILVENGYINQVTENAFEFKSYNIWKIIVSITKNDEIFEGILNNLYELLNLYTQSSAALIGYIVQKLNNNDHSFEVWTMLMKQAAKIGDISLYIIAQKQSLKLIENKSDDFYIKVKKNINIRVGKLLEPIDSNESFKYLQQAVLMLDDCEDMLHIELLGYIASCSMKSGNYFGAIECINNVLSKLPSDKYFSKMLIKSRTIFPLLKLGNYGELINSAETEIIPEIEKVLSKGKDTPQITLKNLFETWLNIYFSLAEAMSFQGDNRALEIIQTIYDILDKNNETESDLICRTSLLLALTNTIKGDFGTSIKILEDILKEYSFDHLDPLLVSRWNFINILNKFFTKDYNSLHTELFNVVAYANNVNDNFTKNILKTLLAKILKDNNQTKKALEILDEQVSYFAKEKIATGVLLSWYLIAEIKLITNGTQYALDVATKALDIAQNPNINNYYFIALFNKLISEIYIAKQDFDSAKVYVEKSIFIAKQFDLQYILVEAYLLCAKLYQELALPKSAPRGEYVKQALKLFQLAKNISVVEKNPSLQKEIKEDLMILTSFCRLNGIILKKENK